MNIFQSNEQRDVGWQYVSLTAGNDDDGIFYCEADNAIGSACLFPPLAGWDDKTPDAASVLLNEPYPGGTIMQFIHFGSPYIRPITETYAQARFGIFGDAAVQTAQYGVRERAAFIERGSRHRLVPTTETRILESYCLWTFKIPLKTQNPFSGSPKETDAFRKECDEFLKLRSRVLSQLTVMGIKANILSTPALMGVLRRYFAVYEDWDTGVEEETPLNEQLFPVGSRMNWDNRRHDLLHCSGFSYSHERQYIGLLAIDRYPGSEKPFHFARMIELLGNPPGDGPQIGMPYALSTTIHFPEQQTKAAKVRTMQGQVEKSANPLMLKWSPKLKKKREGYQQLAQLMVEGGNLVEVSTSLCLFNASANAIRGAQSTLSSYYKRLGFVMRPERYMPEVSFFNQLPLNASPESIKNTHRFKTMGGSHAAHLLPVTDEWQGFGNEMLLTTRIGRLFRYALFDPRNLNYNWVWTGGSGTGKTFAVQRLIQDQLSLGTKIWTLDTGSSYLAAAQAAGAQIIDFDFHSEVSLNPFTKISDIDREIELILPIIGKMAKPLEGLDDTQRALAEEAVKSVYANKGNQAEITDVIQFLNNQTGRMADQQHQLAMLLSPFGSTGSMGRWFRGENNFRTEADWTVIELSGLTTNKHLCDVVLMMLSTTIAQEMFTSRDGRRRMLVVEEGGDRVTDEPFAKFIAQLNSKVRKEDGSVGVVVQTFAQIYSTPHGSAIMASAHTKFHMQQTPEAIAEAVTKKWIQVDAYTEQLMREVQTAKGQYSEILIRSGSSAGIARLIETPFNRVLFNTEGDLFKELQRRVRGGEQITHLVEAEANRLYGDGTS